jgi:hypothetical protein
VWYANPCCAQIPRFEMSPPTGSLLRGCIDESRLASARAMIRFFTAVQLERITSVLRVMCCMQRLFQYNLWKESNG